jgi:hypothetical protein
MFLVLGFFKHGLGCNERVGSPIVDKLIDLLFMISMAKSVAGTVL